MKPCFARDRDGHSHGHLVTSVEVRELARGAGKHRLSGLPYPEVRFTTRWPRTGIVGVQVDPSLPHWPARVISHTEYIMYFANTSRQQQPKKSQVAAVVLCPPFSGQDKFFDLGF